MMDFTISCVLGFLWCSNSKEHLPCMPKVNNCKEILVVRIISGHKTTLVVKESHFCFFFNLDTCHRSSDCKAAQDAKKFCNKRYGGSGYCLYCYEWNIKVCSENLECRQQCLRKKNLNH